MKKLFLIIAAIATVSAASAAIKSESVTYRDGKTVFEGYLAYDDAISAQRPGVLVVHEWMGLNDFAKAKADELAALGYVAFAVDIYGKGVRASNPAEAGKLAGKYKGDRPLMRSRMKAGQASLAKNKLVIPGKLAAIGFCFGGTCVLELARAGSDLAGVVSFHGGLSTPTPADAASLKARVLVLHGADDPHVKPEEVAGFEAEMKAAKADWQLVSYGNTVHAFTNPSVGTDNSKGAAYNKQSSDRAWESMQDFFGEIFSSRP